MKKADAIREHVFHRHIQPARTAGNATVSVTAGQIQSEMSLKESLSAVCAALGSLRFGSAYRVQVRPVAIPLNSSTTEFTIEV
jgi:hypothetical protein